MIFLNKLRLFPFSTKEVAIANKPDVEQYTVFVYPENTSFLQTYNQLRIRKVFVRKLMPVISRYPKVLATAKNMMPYKKLGLMLIRRLGAKSGNVFMDLTNYIDAIDARFQKGNYRRSLVSGRIKQYLNGLRGEHKGRKKVLLYLINLDEEFPRQINFRRIWPVLEMMKEEEQFPFDYFLMGSIRNGVVSYTAFTNEKDALPYNKIRAVLQSMQSKKPDFVMQDESYAAASKAVEKLEFAPNSTDDLATKDKVALAPNQNVERTEEDIIADQEQEQLEEEKGMIKAAVATYLQKLNPSVRKGILNKSPDRDTMYSLATKALLYNISGDLKKAEETVNNTPPEKQKYLFERVKKELLSDIVQRDPPQNDNRGAVHSKVDINKITQNKEPSHIYNKRQIDFTQSFERDLKKSFQLLGNKEYPLKLTKFKKEPVPVDKGDLNPSLYDRYLIELSEGKNKHKVEIQVPRINPDGTFLLNGKKKYLIYQIILDPIYFLKPGHAKLETLYAPVTVWLKQTRRKRYFLALIGGYKLPLITLMAFDMGLEGVLKLFGIKHKLSDEKGPADVYSYQLSDGTYLLLNSPEVAKVLYAGLAETPNVFTKDNIYTKEAFQKAIAKITGNRNASWKVSNVLDNIMEPVAVQVLKTKLQPFTFPQVMKYICEELIRGRVDDRNDISKQRIRSSEVFVHQIQSLILGSYNEYRERMVAGFDDPEYKLDVTEAVKRVVNSKLMDNLENINPTEELSCFTRIKPIGEGGVPDANAITKDARNIHSSYYGNIDSMDTPEGGNVGITNQLTVGAALTSARGSFVDKNEIADDKAGVLGVNSAMVPFVGSCDGNRVMFAGSQGRQAIPISGSQAPLVQTGYESIMTHLLSDSYIKKALDDGVVRTVTDNSISIKLKNNRIQTISLEPQILNAGQGQSSINYFHPVVKEGQNVKKNQIVAEGKHIKDGVISVGTNLLCAVMQWKGYAYEDGYIISDRVAKQKFTSSAYHEIEVLVKPEDNVHIINTQGALTKRGEPLLIRTSKEVEDIVGLGEDELQQGRIITKSPGGTIVSLEIYPNSPISKYPALKEEYQKFKARYEEGKGTMPKKFVSKIGSEKMRFSGVLIRFKIEESQIAEIGDKITNSYGGKGVLAKIEPYENMPVTPWGEHVDLILNPIAIINRMNPSTLKELYTSLVAKFLAKRLAKMGTTKNDKAIELIERVFTVMDGTKDKLYSKQYMKAVRGMSARTYAKWIQEIVDRGYHLPIVVAPFQEPSLNDIRSAMSMVGAKEGYKLHLKEFNAKTSKPIACGWLYYKKLEQQSGIKMSARSTGLVNSQTRQAMAGGKKGGGQKIGEMDSWAIINHGATNVLREFFGPLADDHVTKDQIIADIIQQGTAEYRTPRTSPTKDLFDTYIKGMMIEPDAKG